MWMLSVLIIPIGVLICKLRQKQVTEEDWDEAYFSPVFLHTHDNKR